ncbi:PAS domain-containing protein, partial [bacterium]|nr:PAS domain-containing protein [bacterium]
MNCEILTSSVYKNIIDSIADGVFVVDNQWSICMLNKAAEKIIGITSDQARGKLCSSIFHSSICDGQCALKQSIESGTPVVNKAIYIIRPDGETVPISITASPLRNEEGKVIGGVETFRDLTEINLLREQLQSKYKIGDFISKSSNMQRMFSIIPDISQSISTVLISGESGTGKE